MLPASTSRDWQNKIDRKPGKQQMYYQLKATEDIICMVIPCFRLKFICLIDRDKCL